MNVLTIAVHPDDETLGCGGTLLKHAAAGAELHWLIVTSATRGDYSAEAVRTQEQQVGAVRDAMNFATMDWLKLPTTRLEGIGIGGIIPALRSVVERLRPETVYIPNRSDVHSDHRVVFQACAAVLKTFYMRPLGVRRVLLCEVPSETDAAPPFSENAFLPQVFVDISATLERKLEVMSLFKSEVQQGFLPRGLDAIRALARHRGATIGVEYAEAFQLLRELC